MNGQQASLGHSSNLVGWTPPPPGILKCNVDVAKSDVSSIATGVAVIRSRDGAFVRAWSFPIPYHQDSLQLEVEAVRSAIQLAISHGFCYLLVESDCKALVQLAHSMVKKQQLGNLSVANSEKYSLIADVVQAIKNVGGLNLVWNGRNGNKLVDKFCSFNLGSPNVLT